MTAAGPAPAPQELPEELDDLRVLWLSLPPSRVRWRTDRGRYFQKCLSRTLGHYSAQAVADAIGVPKGTVYAIRSRPLRTKVVPWPSDETLREFRGAWRVVEGQRRRKDRHAVIRRTSPQYAAVHAALVKLKAFNSLDVIAEATGVSLTELRRFTGPPLGHPKEREELARLIALRTKLPAQSGRIRISGEFAEAVRDTAAHVAITKIAIALDMDVHVIERICRSS